MSKIEINIEQVNRLNAINNMAEAIKYLAKSLSQNATVSVNDCIINSKNNGIEINNADELMETKIFNINEKED